MSQIADHYELYYANKLWNLLPAIYRALDTDNYDSNGPLREMVNRIGAQAAILRRSIDRMWDDQSIETCDDWLIPYIGNLVATNLVANLDARAQRLDVASTIDYRRRKGTMGLLEELAFNITGWNARVVEFFRRLSRTRHGLDPQVGAAPSAGDGGAVLLQAEGLIGPLTRTPIGGTADLRNVYGASKTGTAFDEYFHTADFRVGRGSTGWYNIPRLGVFLWRLKSFGVPQTTPVSVSGCQNWFTFDPTGRDISLFAAARESDQYGQTTWVSPPEQQLPGPISQTLFDTNSAVPLASPPAPPCNTAPADAGTKLYADSLAVWTEPDPASAQDYVPVGELKIRPERGRFRADVVPPAGLWTTYHYGFSSEIGAGPYDRRLVRNAPPMPLPQRQVSGGLAALMSAGSIPTAGTLTLADSLTCDGAVDVSLDAGASLTIIAADLQRPLIRLPAAISGVPGTWTITGSSGSSLVLDGLFVSGGDLVLAGTFQSVTINCCTMDPGTSADATAQSLPGGFAVSADDRPLAPTRLWIEAEVETLSIGYSIAGPIQTRNGGKVQSLCIANSIVQAIPGSAADGLQSPLSPPRDAADAAILLDDGDVCLSRCTVLGQVTVHRLSASECILADVVTVDDTQHGCVRFTAWSAGSVIPSQYQSVCIGPKSPLFTSTDFGRPGYCQLLETVDSQIVAGAGTAAATPNTISAGSQNGSEMGAFAREQSPVKARGLLIKFAEYMPAGLVPVIVYVT